MTSLLHLDILGLVRMVGYPGLFTIIFLESGVFFGFFLPGASLLFAAGILASFGIFNIWILAPLLVIAAILGDSAGYWFGQWIGAALYMRQDSRWFKKKHLEEAHRFFEQHGSMAIFLARFVPVVRTFTPIVAGAAKMRYVIFLRWNVLGGVIWSAGILLAGYFLGRAIPSAEKYLLPISILIVIITLIPLFLRYLSARRNSPKNPRAIMFDLDDTLAASFQAPSEHIMKQLEQLLEHMPVGIITGASYDRVAKDVAARIRENLRARLFLFPTSSAEGYRFTDGVWKREYTYEIPPDKAGRIVHAIQETIATTDLLRGYTPRGAQYLNRTTQIAYAFLGIDVSPEDKASWDPDGNKRRLLQSMLAKKLPEYEILIGGRTSIDITKKGVDKSLGVRRFAEWNNISPRDMLYIGDALYAGGNDEVVIKTGIRTCQTSGPAETEKIIDNLLTRLT